jgi:hypothetical protein
MADSPYFFAEDVFGGQFAILEEKIVKFDPETGEVSTMATSLEDWAEQILSDIDFQTGYPVARAWQLENRPLRLGERLLPTRPFVLGGEFSVSNLSALNDAAGMEIRAELALKLRDRPDGTAIRYRVTD